jgi:hypothetical protein
MESQLLQLPKSMELQNEKNIFDNGDYLGGLCQPSAGSIRNANRHKQDDRHG